jgi:hypothetical protein
MFYLSSLQNIKDIKGNIVSKAEPEMVDTMRNPFRANRINSMFIWNMSR